MSESLWKQFDSSEADGLHIVGKMAICDQISKASADDSEKLHVELEKKSLYFILMMHHNLSSLEQFDKTKILSEIQRFTGDSSEFDYYTKRYSKTSNIFDKWRYAFCCWILKKRYDFLLKGIEHLFDVCRRGLGEEKYPESVTLLIKIFNLARFYNLISTSTDIRKRITEYALDIINTVRKTHNARWMIEPSEILALIKNSIEAEKASELISSLHYDAKEFRSNKNYHLFRSLIEASVGICDFLHLELSEVAQLKRTFQQMIAESFEEEGDSRLEQDGAFVAIVFYQDAITQYRKINEQSKIDELNVKIRSLNSRALNEMDVIETRFQLPKLEFKAQNEYDLIKEIIQYTKSFIPSIKRTEQNVKQALEEHPLSLTARNVTFSDRNPISYDSDDQSITASNIARELNWNIQIADQYLGSAISELEDAGKITSEGYGQFISDCGLLDSSSFRLVKQGIDRHIAKDHISSIHILIPQIEATLRTLLNSRGINTLKTKGDVIMDNQLGGLLRNPEARTVLGEDLATYLEVKLVDQEGTNLRNELSHGLLSYEKFAYNESLATIRIILLLNALSVNARKD